MSHSTSEEFASHLEAYRRELTTHCYRLVGAVSEAEDLAQETVVRAWRAKDSYDSEKASLRTWLYKIATNVCLTALKGRRHRPLPTGLGGPSQDPDAPLVPAFEVPWLQPFPQRLADPASDVGRRGSLRLALIAAMQLLPPKQRAVLILRDVLDFSAAEVAEFLDTSAVSVNSALQRARTNLSEPIEEEEVAEPTDRSVVETVERYVAAFERADVEGLVSLLTEQAVLEMPPVPLWYLGAEDYGRFMSRVFAMRGEHWRVRALSANEQPALAAYCRDDQGVYRLHTLQVLTVTSAGVAHNTVFQDPQVFRAFELLPEFE